MARGTSGRADVARGTNAWMRRGTEAMWQSHGWPARGAGGADTWQEATWMGPRGRLCGVPCGKGAGDWRAHGLVGPG